MKSYIWEQTARIADIQLDWPNIEGGVVAAGTPISFDGRVANDETAVGILLYTAIYVNGAMANNGPVPVLVGGVCQLAGAEADSGLTFEDDAILAMKDITFLDEDGGVITPSGDINPFEQMDNIPSSEAESLADLVSDFNDLLTALKGGGFMAEDEPEPESEPEPEPEPGEGEE